MPNPLLVAGGIKLGSSILGKLFGGKPKTEAVIPDDLKQTRAQNIGMLNFLLGMGRDPRQDMFTSWEDRIPGYGKYKPKTRQKLREAWDRQETRKVIGQPFNGIPAATTKDALFAPATGMGTPGMAPAAAPAPQFAPGAAGGPLVQRLAGGGMVSGPGGPTDDMVPALLSNGEGVLNTDAVDAVGGPQMIHLINALSRAGGPQRMADGGIAGDTTKLAPTLPGALPGGNIGTTTTPTTSPTPTDTGSLPVLKMDTGATGATNTTGQLPGMQTLPPPPTGGYTMPGMTGGTGTPQVGGAMTPQQRLESFLGPMGINQSNLQQAATAGWMGQLTNVSPEQRAAEMTLPQLQQNLGGSPYTQQAINQMMGLQAGAGADVEGRLGQLGTGSAFGSSQMDSILRQLAGGDARFGQFGQGPSMGSEQMQGLLGQLASGGGLSNMGQAQLQNLAGGGANLNFSGGGAGMSELAALARQNQGERVMESLNPAFQRNLAAANQQGGRFGSANAVLRSRAVDDFNAQAAQALQRGVDQQIAAASNLGSVGNQQDALRLQALTTGQGTQFAAAQQLANLGNQQDRLRLEALGLTQSGAQSQQDVALRALLGQQQGQLGALGLAQQGQQGLTDAQLRAMATLGGFRQNEAQAMGNIFQGAGQLGLGQGQMQNQAAQTIAQILGQQGSSDLARLQGAFGAGVTNTGMENYGQQQAMQYLQQLFGASLGATLGGPVTQTPSLGQDVAQLGNSLGDLYYQNAMTPSKGT